MLLSINTHIIDKPADPDFGWFNKGFTPHDLSADELITQIQSGHAFSAQFVGGKRKSANFTAAGVLAVDVDEGLTLAEALAFPFVQQYAAFLYTTASHTADQNRFRVVFELAAPITDGKRYQAALTGLIAKFGGDKTCKDPARLFFGFSGAEVHLVGKTLPPDEVAALVASSKATQSSKVVVSTRGTLTAADTSMTMESIVKKADGSEVPLSVITSDDNSIHCPFHIDRHASACVVFADSGSVGIFCNTCGKTVWVYDARKPVDFDWHIPYQQQASEFLSQWQDHVLAYGSTAKTPQFIARDGTNVWLYDQEHLPEVPIHPGLTFIRSPKGSGKTVQLTAIVDEFKRQGKSILLVGHRRMLLRSLAERLDLPCYLNPGAKDELAETGSIVVSLESLNTFVIPNPKIKPFDVIILDESEQVVSHFASDTLAKQRMGSLSLIEHLVQRATYVICADADMGLLTSGFFYLTQNKSHPDSLIINRHQLGGSGQAENAGLVASLDLYDDKKSLLAMLAKDFSEGRRCFVASNSKKQAESIVQALKSLCPEKAILLITSTTGRLKETKAFIRQPSVMALKYDAVICSPALSTGVDISFPGGERKFDSVYGFFRDGVTTHFEIDQQLSRVRNPGAVRVWVSSTKRGYEWDPSVIWEELVRSREAAQYVVGYSPSGDVIHTDNKVLELISWIWHLKRSALANLKEHFIALKKQNGWIVNVVDSASRTTWNEPVSMDEHRLSVICESKDLNRKEYEWLKIWEKGSGVTAEQDAQMRKYEIHQQYGVKVSPELIKLDDDGKFVGKFWNLTLLYLGEKGLLEEDRMEVTYRGQSSFDWSMRSSKKQLLERLLSAAGLYDPKTVLSFEQVSKESLGAFVDVVIESRREMSRLLGLSVRDGDIRSKPVIQLKHVLDTIGMKLGGMERIVVGGVRTDYYRLDRSHWEHVVTTCGLARHLVFQQIVDDQIDMEGQT